MDSDLLLRCRSRIISITSGVVWWKYTCTQSYCEQSCEPETLLEIPEEQSMLLGRHFDPDDKISNSVCKAKCMSARELLNGRCIQKLSLLLIYDSSRLYQHDRLENTCHRVVSADLSHGGYHLPDAVRHVPTTSSVAGEGSSHHPGTLHRWQ